MYKSFCPKLKVTRINKHCLRCVFAVLFGFVFSVLLSPNIFTVYADEIDVSESWSFSSSGDYTVSDSNLVEVSDNSARLKVRNYSSDANTVGLFHFDEESGSVAEDSSSYGKDGLVVDGTFAPSSGVLNGQLELNGTSSQVVVSSSEPSSPLHFSSSHTLESWVSFSDDFDPSVDDTVNGKGMGILDKGSYKLYFDDETGSLNYEISSTTVDTTWTQIGGGEPNQDSINNSWNLNGNQAVTAVGYYQNLVYVGLGYGATDAEVWRWDGSDWTKIGGDGVGWGATTIYEEVTSMEVDSSGNVYVGLGLNNSDAEVYMWNGSGWSKIGGDGTGATPSSLGWSSGSPGPYEVVYSLLHDGTYLYAGLGLSASDAEVWRWSGSVWEKIGGDGFFGGWGSGYDGVYSLASDGTYVYAGLGITTGEAEVYRWNGTDDWDKVGGDGVGSSWNTGYEAALSLYANSTHLYAGLGTGTSDSHVFRCALPNCSTWEQVGGGGTGWANGVYDRILSMTGSGTDVYVGMGVSGNDADVWKYNGSSWSQIGGDGTGWANDSSYYSIRDIAYSSYDGTLYAGIQQNNGSGELYGYKDDTWTRYGGNYKNKSWGYYGLNSVESLVKVGDYLYAGTGRTVNANRNITGALVWQYDGISWDNVPVGGMGINGSWDSTTMEHEYVHSMTSYNGKLYVGLGSSTNDAEVWSFDNVDTWELVGGDAVAGWGTGFEQVNALISYEDYLYAGLGTGAGDGEVWRYNETIGWECIANGNASSEGASGWTSALNSITAMTIYDGKLHVGTGNGNDEADVWVYDGSSWSKLRDSTSFSAGYNDVESMAVYKGDLYVGFGAGISEADVWKYNGSDWAQIGGDGTGETTNTYGWDSTYERVRSMVVYNGELYASLGDTTGDGEVWKYNGTEWTRIGGDATKQGWNATVEYVNDLHVYKGKLIAATGYSVNADAMVWSYGDNKILSTTQTSWDSDDRYHVAATYDGSTMELKVTPLSTGVTTTTSRSASVTIADNELDLLIGSDYGSESKQGSQGFFAGSLDEVRLSNVRRTSFTTTPFCSQAQTVHPSEAVFQEDVAYYTGFSATEVADGGTVTYRLSDDGGTTWKYWNVDSWEVSSSLSEANSSTDINTNITTFPITAYGIVWQAIFLGDGTQQVSLTDVIITAEPDTSNPTPPTSLTVTDSESGTDELVSDTWYLHEEPYFSWSGATDIGDAGVGGYCVYFGQDADAIPCSEGVGEFQEESYYVPESMTSGTVYYFRVQTKDNAQNTSTLYPETGPFIYKFDNRGPSLPGTVSVSPPGYTAVNEYTFLWPSSGVSMAKDCTAPNICSGLAGYQYKIDEDGEWSDTITQTEIVITDAAYQDGVNYFYLRAIDNAYNVSSDASGNPLVYNVPFYFAGTAPTAPLNLTANPVTTAESPSTSNLFTFTWDPPEPGGYSGSESNLTYCYSINAEPNKIGDVENCTYTAPGVTAVGPQAFANLPGKNTFYVSAKDEVGNINYGAFAHKDFYVNTAAPGIPINVEIADVSVKSTSSWKLAISWDPPTVGAVSKYEVHRSLDNSSFSRVSSVEGGIAFVDTGLEQQTYYYKVRACDNTNNCGAFSSVVSMMPTGRFMEAASLSSDPVVSNITTKKATISWSTSRTSDSKVQYGTGEGDYFDEEPSNSDQVTDHEINLSNLSPGTTYYFVAKWTDEDGNTGISDEYEFDTQPAPTVTDPQAKDVSIDNATIEFTVEGASKVKIYYGDTSVLGRVLELSTSTSETTYSMRLEGLKDETKYYYKINTFDSEDDEYEGNLLTFQTLPRPKIENVNILQIRGAAKTSVLVSWTSNTPISSIVTYYPKSSPGDVRDIANVALTSGKHRAVIEDLLPQTAYNFIVSGKDRVGNEVRSDNLDFTTANDTRPPYIENLKVEGSMSPAGTDSSEKLAQLVISWDTDEPSTAQIEFGEGTGSTYAQKTKEDSSMTYNHVVILSNLSPSKVYHFRAISRDSAGNVGYSVDTVTITPKATDDALGLVISSLQQVFGFLGTFQ